MCFLTCRRVSCWRYFINRLCKKRTRLLDQCSRPRNHHNKQLKTPSCAIISCVAQHAGQVPGPSHNDAIYPSTFDPQPFSLFPSNPPTIFWILFLFHLSWSIKHILSHTLTWLIYNDGIFLLVLISDTCFITDKHMDNTRCHSRLSSVEIQHYSSWRTNRPVWKMGGWFYQSPETVHWRRHQ